MASHFVYVDYLVTEAAVQRDLDNPPKHGYYARFLGYHRVERITLTQADLTPGGWVSHGIPLSHRRAQPQIQPYGFLEIMERDANRDESHGAQRLFILFLGADGYASYDALFCQNSNRPPYAVVLQDHGFGGNYDKFGQGGLLEQIAINTQCFPEYLFVTSNTRPWTGYELVADIEGTHVGRYQRLSRLYRRTGDCASPLSLVSPSLT